MPYLIVNADDFGLTSGMNRGIVDCFLVGSVSSASLFMNMPATLEAVDLAREYPSLGVGLHFNITLGEPLCPPSKIPSLIGADGSFRNRADCEKRLLFGLAEIKDIEREFRAQLERFTAFGLSITHIDSHHHIHLLPKVFGVIAAYCSKKNIPMRIPWAWPQIRLGMSRNVNLGILGKYSRRFIRDLLLRSNVYLWGKKLKCNAGFGSVFDVCEAPHLISRQSYYTLLSEAKRFPFEIMVHPAWVDEALRDYLLITSVCEKEREILSSISLREEAEKRGLQWGSYRDAFGLPD